MYEVNMINSIGEILNNKMIPDAKPAAIVSRITKEWQSKAFHDMEYIGVKLSPRDIGRVFKIYKSEAEGKFYKAKSSRVISYLKDYPYPLDYSGKLKMFFKLITNGFGNF